MALTGVLATACRPGQAPVLPPTIVGDMAGGAMFLAFGLVCALHEARQYDHRSWPALKARVAAQIRTRSRSQWQQALEDSDACFAPVLSLAEAAEHPHNAARGLFVEVNGQRQPAPAPRFSRTPTRTPGPGTLCGEHTGAILAELENQTTPAAQ